MEITPGDPLLALTRSKALTAVAYDSAGAILPGIVFTWSSSNPAVVSTTTTGTNTATVMGHDYGSVTISATPRGAAAATTVVQVATAATVVVMPTTSYVGVNAPQQLTAQAYHAAGRPLEHALFEWTTPDPHLAIVVPSAESDTATVFGQVGETHTAGLAMFVLAEASFATGRVNPRDRLILIWAAVSSLFVTAFLYPRLMNWIDKRGDGAVPDGHVSSISFVVGGALSAWILLIVGFPVLIVPSGWPQLLFVPRQLWLFLCAYASAGAVYGFVHASERAVE